MLKKREPTLGGVRPWRSRKGPLGPGLTGWRRHFHRAHVPHIGAREVAPLLGALVVPEEPAQVLGLLLAALAVAVQGHQGGLADGQKIPGLQIQVLLLVLGKCMEGDVLETFHRHFVRRVRLKMAAGETIQLRAWLHQERWATRKSSGPRRGRLIRQKRLAWWFGETGEKGGREESPEAQQHFETSIRLPSAAFTPGALF